MKDRWIEGRDAAVRECKRVADGGTVPGGAYACREDMCIAAIRALTPPPTDASEGDRDELIRIISNTRNYTADRIADTIIAGFRRADAGEVEKYKALFEDRERLLQNEEREHATQIAAAEAELMAMRAVVEAALIECSTPFIIGGNLTCLNYEILAREFNRRQQVASVALAAIADARREMAS